MKRLLPLLLMVVAVGSTSSIAEARPIPPGPSVFGYVHLVVQHGPICTKAKCINVPLPGSKVQLLYRGTLLKTYKTNRSGIVNSIRVPAITAGYTLKITSVISGQTRHQNVRVPMIPTGRTFSIEANFCGNIC